MKWNTFNQWSNKGYKIKKGSKATWFDGTPKFSSKQVEKILRQYSIANYDEYDDAFYGSYWDYYHYKD